MCDAPTEARGLRILFVDVQTVRVTADRGEQQNIGIGNRFTERRTITDGKLFV
jgi:hypothetical protein